MRRLRGLGRVMLGTERAGNRSREKVHGVSDGHAFTPRRFSPGWTQSRGIETQAKVLVNVFKELCCQHKLSLCTSPPRGSLAVVSALAASKVRVTDRLPRGRVQCRMPRETVTICPGKRLISPCSSSMTKPPSMAKNVSSELGWQSLVPPGL